MKGMSKDNPNRRYGPTPSGGVYSEIYYFNDTHEVVEPEEATIGVIREYKGNGILVNETWFMMKG